jgi:hypothetical protein
VKGNCKWEKEYLSILTNAKAIEKIIKCKGNLSASGIDMLTFPIFKWKAKKSVNLIIKMMSMVVKTIRCPNIWKQAKTILLLYRLAMKKKECNLAFGDQ